MIRQDHSDITPLEAARVIARGAKQFYNELRGDEHSRFRSWEHCYLAFHAARNCQKPDIDYLWYRRRWARDHAADPPKV